MSTSAESQKAPGWYYVGYVTVKSLMEMPPALKAKFGLGMPLSNTKPFETKQAARRDAKAHSLRDIMTIRV